MHRAAPPTDVDDKLIDELKKPQAYPHPVDDIEVIETHISWLLLAGAFAYKIKKPLDLGFLDYRDLERRRFYCEEEIRLNKPWAPEIYLDVVPITLTAGGQTAIAGSGDVLEYAVKMRRFDQSQRLDAQLDTGNLSVDDMRELADMLAARHVAAARTDTSRRRHAVHGAISLIRDNFAPLAGAIDEALLQRLHDWTWDALAENEAHFFARFDQGFFRECHGDLHLGNLVRLAGGITTFDCIEFNEDLRQTDVVADIAFLVMDLVARRQLELAAHFLNRYLEFTGDFGGMRVFNLYFTYRCLVRAKIAVIRASERHNRAERVRDIEEAHVYCRMAAQQIASRRPVLVTMTGLSGSGKTWVSSRLMAALPAIRVRTDIERKRLFGVGETADTDSRLAAGMYAPDVSQRIYALLNETASDLLAAQHNVILDGSFLKERERTAAHAVAERCGYDFVLLHTVADEDTLRARIAARQKEQQDASEANKEVLEYQLGRFEPLNHRESSYSVRCDSSALNMPELLEGIRAARG